MPLFCLTSQLQRHVKIFLSIKHICLRYLKCSTTSGLSNSPTLDVPRHIELILKHFSGFSNNPLKFRENRTRPLNTVENACLAKLVYLVFDVSSLFCKVMFSNSIPLHVNLFKSFDQHTITFMLESHIFPYMIELLKSHPARTWNKEEADLYIMNFDVQASFNVNKSYPDIHLTRLRRISQFLLNDTILWKNDGSKLLWVISHWLMIGR